jgi:hypothetical protein
MSILFYEAWNSLTIAEHGEKEIQLLKLDPVPRPSVSSIKKMSNGK